MEAQDEKSFAKLAGFVLVVNTADLGSVNGYDFIDKVHDIPYVVETEYSMGSITVTVNMEKFRKAHGSPDFIQAIIFAKNRLAAVKERLDGK